MKTAVPRCKRNHPYDAANTYVSTKGLRQCRACRKLARQRREPIHSIEQTPLTEAQVRRMRDAFGDGVPMSLLSERFGVGISDVRRICGAEKAA